MKSILTIFLFLNFIHGFSQKNISIPTPPNCVQISDSLFIDKTEIANIHWLEFLHFLERDSSREVYEAALPDTTVWYKVDSSKVDKYLRYPGYRYYPVVGISYNQAVEYCKWRSAAVTKTANSNFDFTFRLPTEKEWELAAEGTLNPDDFPFGYENYEQKPTLKKDWKLYYNTIESSKKIDEEYFKHRFAEFKKSGHEVSFNCLKPFDSLFQYGALKPLSISEFSKERKMIPNKLGIYDMIGNVAEMVHQQGIAKGGSWGSTLEDCKIKNRSYYLKPSPFIGFRCVCEVRKNND